LAPDARRVGGAGFGGGRRPTDLQLLLRAYTPIVGPGGTAHRPGGVRLGGRPHERRLAGEGETGGRRDWSGAAGGAGRRRRRCEGVRAGFGFGFGDRDVRRRWVAPGHRVQVPRGSGWADRAGAGGPYHDGAGRGGVVHDGRGIVL